MNIIRRFLARLVSFEIEKLENEVEALSKSNEHFKSIDGNMFRQNHRLIQDKSVLEEENEQFRRHLAWLEIDNNKYALRIKELEHLRDELFSSLDYHKKLNACYAADRQAMMAEPGGPDQAARKFPRVTKFLNEREGKGE